MAQAGSYQVIDSETFTDLPLCVQSLPDDEHKCFAEAILQSLASVSDAIPEKFRSDKSPAQILGAKKASFIVLGVAEGRKFKQVQRFESDGLKFVGIAAGTLQAIEMKALGYYEARYFREHFHNLVSTLKLIANDGKIWATQSLVYPQSVRAKLLDGIPFGVTTVIKCNGFKCQVNRNKGLVFVEDFLFLPIKYKPFFKEGEESF